MFYEKGYYKRVVGYNKVVRESIYEAAYREYCEDRESRYRD